MASLKAPSIAAFSRLIKAKSIRHYSAPVDGTIPAIKQKHVPTSGTYPKGFLVSGTYVGVKATNKSRPDLAFLASETPCTAAAVFTKNVFQAAPVTVSRKMLERRENSGIRSIIVNSGCANAVTGAGGLADAEKMGEYADNCFKAPEDGKGGSSIVMSTGVIGQRLPIEKILQKIPVAYEGLGNTHEHWMAAAQAICTTDTFPKLVSRTFTLPSSPGIEYRIAGMTKGAGMIHPNMATLLGMIATDAPVSSKCLQKALISSVNVSFNAISIDGDTSTNDTVAILANGAAGGVEITQLGDKDYLAFIQVLKQTTQDLAKLVVRDGEGATKFITIRVTGASDRNVALSVARSIATSPLVKTALYGKDANWGRIICATGYANISNQGQKPHPHSSAIKPEKTSVSFIPSDGSPELKLLVNGEPEAVDEVRAAGILEHEDIEILVDLGTEVGKRRGSRNQALYWTCDFSHEYITINGDYRT